MGELIGHGAFGDVYRGRYDDSDVAVKVLSHDRRRDMDAIDRFAQEALFVASMQHERIVLFIGVAWTTPSDLCIVSEFMAGGDLQGLLRQYRAEGRAQGLTPDKIKIALHIAHALTYLHSLDPVVLHRDLNGTTSR
ncbi:hypothetical protein ATCC90586_011691 [Pythium insidiosum]|nr:hypothetical protein ATCC90586_011691 [Pythium insidiosum]